MTPAPVKQPHGAADSYRKASANRADRRKACGRRFFNVTRRTRTQREAHEGALRAQPIFQSCLGLAGAQGAPFVFFACFVRFV
jgi:hypothetical protein